MQLKLLTLSKPLPTWRPALSSRAKNALMIPANILLAMICSLVMLLLIGAGFLISSRARRH